MYLTFLTFLGLNYLAFRLFKHLYSSLWSALLTFSIVQFTLSSCAQFDSQPNQNKESRAEAQGTAKDEEREKAIPVEVHKLTLGTVRSTVKAVSILSPKEKASVRSLISGLISELHVEEGDRVKAKQRLALITRPGAKSLIRKAASLYRKSKHDVKQLESLVRKGLAPREELTQAKFNRDQSGIELTRLREEAKNEVLRSPIGGVVVSRPLYRGETVSPGQAIFEIMDLSQIYAPLNLPDRWSTMIYEGMSARLFDRDGQLLSDQAVVSHVSPIIDANTGTFSVWVSPEPKKVAKIKRSRRKQTKSKIKLGSPTNSKLKPGLFVSAEITLGEHKNVVVIPREAVIYKDGNAQVAVVKNERIVLLDVKIGYQEAEFLEVLSPLNAGDIVVIFGQRGLESGTYVKTIWPKKAKEKTTETQASPKDKPDEGDEGQQTDRINSSMKR